MNIYVANIPFSLTEKELESVFAEYGDVLSVKIIKDKVTGKSRGFAFVEMESEEDGEKAVNELDQAQVKGREIKVKKALPRTR